MTRFEVLRASPGFHRATRVGLAMLQFAVLVLAGLAPAATPAGGFAFPQDADVVSAVVLGGLSVVISVGRRWAVALTGFVLVVGVAMTVLGHAYYGYVLACAIAVFHLAYRGRRLVTIVVAAAAAVAMGAALAAEATTPREYTQVVGILATIAFAAAVGDAIHSRRAFIAAMTERAVRAEQSRDEEARRRVAEERIRIARELHDAAAHQIAVINLQAGAASAALADGRTTDTERSLQGIRTAARGVLSEISALLVVLRTEGGASSGIQPPAHGLSDIPALVEGFQEAGLQVDAHLDIPATVPGAVDLVAYKVVQEALANAHKHGADQQARLDIQAEEVHLAISVTNRTAELSHPPLEGGHGLIGLKERVDSVGGTMVATHTFEQFTLDVRLPTESEAI